MNSMKMKKILGTVMALSIVMSGNVLASETDTLEISNYDVTKQVDSESSEDYIKFLDNKERINSDGSFEFDVRFEVTSNKFKIKSGATSIKISTSAIIENGYGDNVTWNYPNHEYEITLYGDNWFGKSKTFTANGDNEYVTYSGLDSSKEYYIAIRNLDKLPAGTSVVGNGTISNYININ